MRVYLQKGYVLPVHAKENSLIVMGGSFQREMCHWTVNHRNIVRSQQRLPLDSDAEVLLTEAGIKAVQSYMAGFRYATGDRIVPRPQ